MPPLIYDANAKVQPEVDPKMIVLVRRVRVRPTLIFRGRVEGVAAAAVRRPRRPRPHRPMRRMLRSRLLPPAITLSIACVTSSANCGRADPNRLFWPHRDAFRARQNLRPLTD